MSGRRAVEMGSNPKVCELLLETRGPLTGDEIDAIVGWPDRTASRCLSWMVGKGTARTNGEARVTRSGRAAVVYEVTP